jgi:hypothetical protein
MATLTSVRRKTPAKRRFVGLAGSPLSRTIREDHTLHAVKSFDRQEPIGFDPWWDEFGQRHAQIDIDNDFQQRAFDRALHGAIPEGTDHLANHVNPETSVMQDLGVDLKVEPKKRTGIKFGLLPGEREVTNRRPTDKTWWIFESDLLREFIRAKYDDGKKGPKRAEAAILVLYHYYRRNRQDADIFEETSLFKDKKSLKNFRQRLVAEGSALHPDRPTRSRRERRPHWYGGQKCEDPNCQCTRNEVSNDFSGRAA